MRRTLTALAVAAAWSAAIAAVFAFAGISVGVLFLAAGPTGFLAVAAVIGGAWHLVARHVSLARATRPEVAA